MVFPSTGPGCCVIGGPHRTVRRRIRGGRPTRPETAQTGRPSDANPGTRLLLGPAPHRRGRQRRDCGRGSVHGARAAGAAGQGARCRARTLYATEPRASLAGWLAGGCGRESRCRAPWRLDSWTLDDESPACPYPPHKHTPGTHSAPGHQCVKVSDVLTPCAQLRCPYPLPLGSAAHKIVIACPSDPAAAACRRGSSTSSLVCCACPRVSGVSFLFSSRPCRTVRLCPRPDGLMSTIGQEIRGRSDGGRTAPHRTAHEIFDALPA